VAVKGGIATLIKTAHLAEAFGLQEEVHHGGNSLNNVANLHVIMTIRNCEFFEVLLPDAAQKYGLARDITVGPGGSGHAPTAPGLGAPFRDHLAVVRSGRSGAWCACRTARGSASRSIVP
jgi:L-alanine-DL-glutamate epimerase-like enolase superfamily enzyme